MEKMKAVVFQGVDDLRIEEVPKPRPRAGEAVIRILATTICGTDVHIVKGEYPVRQGLILGHEPVGVIEELGEGLEDEYQVGDRVIVGAITPCGQCFYCLNDGALPVRRRTGRMALRQHNQRRVGGIPARSPRPRQSRQGSRRPDRRAGADAPGHRIDRHFRRGERTASRIGDTCRRVRTGADRALRHRRRQAFAARRSSSASTRSRRGRSMALRFGADAHARSGDRRRRGAAEGADRRAGSGRRDRSAGSTGNVRGRAQIDAGPVACCPASASTPASSSHRTRRSSPAWVISRSSPRSAPVAKSGCGG